MRGQYSSKRSKSECGGRGRSSNASTFTHHISTIYTHMTVLTITTYSNTTILIYNNIYSYNIHISILLEQDKKRKVYKTQ